MGVSYRRRPEQRLFQASGHRTHVPYRKRRHFTAISSYSAACPSEFGGLGIREGVRTGQTADMQPIQPTPSSRAFPFSLGRRSLYARSG